VTSGGRFSRVDMSDDDDVNVSLFLSHFIKKFLLDESGCG
jgi:hypothetical protein